MIVLGFRASQENSRGTSFGTISAFGSNGAIIHYSPTPETDARITRWLAPDTLHQSLMHQSHQRRAVHGGLWRPVPGRNDRCDANVPLRNPNRGDDWALHRCLAGAFCIILPEAPITINKVQEWRMNNVNWTFQQQGAIELARVKAPDGTLDSSVDLATRQFASEQFFWRIRHTSFWSGD